MKQIVRDFSKKVKQIRLSKEMSQGDVAKILGVHRTYISGIERGLTNPSLVTVEKFAKALKVKVDDLIRK